jgi:hypothetical protein
MFIETRKIRILLEKMQYTEEENGGSTDVTLERREPVQMIGKHV